MEASNTRPEAPGPDAPPALQRRTARTTALEGEINPVEFIRSATFSMTRRGYDTREVDALLENVAMLLERHRSGPPAADPAPGPEAAPRTEHPAARPVGAPATLASVSVLPGQRAPAATADPLLLGAAERVLREAWDRARRATSEAENARDRLVAEADALAGARLALEQVTQAYQRDRALLRAQNPTERSSLVDTTSRM